VLLAKVLSIAARRIPWIDYWHYSK